MQTAYNLHQPAAFAGLVFDLASTVSESGAAEGNVGFGLAVVKGTISNGVDGSSQVKVPTASGGVFRGIARHTHSVPQNGANPVGYPDTETVGYLRRGRIWVPVVDAVTEDGAAYFVNTGAKAGWFAAAASDTASAVATANAGNVGNGVMGTITPTVPPARGGIYTLDMTSAGATAAFIVRDPDGVEVGVGAVGTLFNAGGLSFTLADGAVDFAEGDGFTINVDVTFAADAVPTGVFRSSTTGEGLAVVEINLP